MPRSGSSKNCSKRICGTPGCGLPDFHDGICQSQAPVSKRESAPVLPPPPPKKPARPRPTAPRPKPPKPAVALVPAQQHALPDGLHRFYHVHRWGVPLPSGAVDCGPGSDDEHDEGWRHDETTRRIRSRADVGPNDAAVAELWNAHVRSLPPLVSDRMLPDACRKFARAHASRLAAELRSAFAAHLAVLWEHNLLHRDDIEDCILLVDDCADACRSPASKRARHGLKLCDECTRPLHEERCDLFGQARGAAAWPPQQKLAEG